MATEYPFGKKTFKNPPSRNKEKVSGGKKPDISLVRIPNALGFDTLNYPLFLRIGEALPSGAKNVSLNYTAEQLFDRDSTARSAPDNIYYVGTGGSDSNNGLSPSAKKLSWASAITAGNATNKPYKIIVDALEYPRNQGQQGILPTQDIAVVCQSGRAIVGTFDINLAAFTADTTYTNCFSLTITPIDRVLNKLVKNPFGLMVDFTNYPNAQALNDATLTSDGQAYEGGKIYLRRLDGATPNATNTKIFRQAVKNFAVTAEINVYLENIDFEGGQIGAFEYIRPVKAVNRKTVVAKNCTFKYGGGTVNTGGRAVTVDGIKGLAAFFDCEASGGKTDGFNFHDVVGSGTNHLTVRCKAFDNGRAVADSCNGLTGHEVTCSGIDVGSVYENNRGGTIRGSEGKILVAGSFVKNDLGAIIIGGASPPCAVQSSGAEYWLDRVTIDMPVGQQAVMATGTGKIHKNKVELTNSKIEGGSGTIDFYNG